MSKMVFQLQEGARLQAGLTPDILGNTLEDIRVKNDGHLTPETVLKAAKRKSHPLYSQFEWDDAVAAGKYRLDEARYLIRSVVVKVEGREDRAPVRAFVSVGPPNQSSYTSVQVAMSDFDMRQEVIGRALNELRSWSDRYYHLVEFSGIVQAINDLEV